MSILLLNANGPSKNATKEVEILKLNGKFYIELKELKNSDCIIELSIALASENEALKERILILEEKLSKIF
ncbi:MAG: hypothetical protein M3421_00020 [Bacteroidota bacterium]|nr:hypothetical protein [Bacteroidota bacterium]